MKKHNHFPYHVVGLTVLVFVPVFLFTAVLRSPTAHAGVNGQQIAIKTSAFSVRVDGDNQNGQEVSSCFDLVYTYPAASDGYHYLTGWWWKGLVFIDYYNDNACSPPNQGEDTVYCQPIAYDWIWHTGAI